jgi:hypothetical protein
VGERIVWEIAMSVDAGTRANAAVEATLNYVTPDTKISRRFCFPGDEVNTGRFEPHRVTIHNARLAAEPIARDTHGFELIRHRSVVRNFSDRAELDAIYRPEVMDAIQALTGADLVVPMGYVLRSSADTADGKNQPPASDVHVDMSPRTAPMAAQALFAAAAPGRTFRRFLATSFWRPYSPPPQDWPVALCDHRSISSAEGIPNLRIVREHRPRPEEMLAPIPNEDEVPAALIFRYAPEHRWYYFPDMTRDECLLIKLHDSDHDRAWFAAHTAFHDKRRAATHTRESIEFRTIAYFY